jgi:hypothetical protein
MISILSLLLMGIAANLLAGEVNPDRVLKQLNVLNAGKPNPAPPCSGCAVIKDGSSKRSPIPLFSQPPGFEIELIGYFPDGVGPGKLRYAFNGEVESIDATFVPRGVHRREVCPDFPPFKIELNRINKGKLFKNSDRDLKFVTHCKHPPTDEANENIIQEYALYRVLEASGLSGFLTQLVTVTYRNQLGMVVAEKVPGFFIENQRDANERLFGKSPATQREFKSNPGEYQIAEVLVQNQDHDPGHNTRVIASPKAPDEKLTLPYDFDQSNLINPTYWKNEGVNWDDVASLGSIVASHGEEAKAALRKVLSNKVKMLAAVSLSGMKAENKQKFRVRLDRFFAAAEVVLNPAQKN